MSPQSINRVISRWACRIASSGKTIVQVYPNRVALQSVPTDPERQVYDVYLLQGGVKALKAGIQVAKEHKAHLEQLSVYDAYEFVNDAIFKQTGMKGKWHSYSMPD